MPVNLNVLRDPNQRGMSFPETTAISFKYAKLVITEKNWSNLFQRIWDAITHIFCKQVVARDSDSKNKLFWVKGECAAKPTISFSLANPPAARRNSSEYLIEEDTSTIAPVDDAKANQIADAAEAKRKELYAKLRKEKKGS